MSSETYNPPFGVAQSSPDLWVWVQMQVSSDVTFDTEALKLLSKNETSHIEALFRGLTRFTKNTWSITSEALFAWKPHNCFSIWFKRSEPQHSFSTAQFYIILHYNAFALFYFYPNLYIKVKLTFPIK